MKSQVFVKKNKLTPEEKMISGITGTLSTRNNGFWTFVFPSKISISCFPSISFSVFLLINHFPPIISLSPSKTFALKLKKIVLERHANLSCQRWCQEPRHILQQKWTQGVTMGWRRRQKRSQEALRREWSRKRIIKIPFNIPFLMQKTILSMR